MARHSTPLPEAPLACGESDARDAKEAVFVLLLVPALLLIVTWLFRGAENSDRYDLDLSRALPKGPSWLGSTVVYDDMAAILATVPRLSIFEARLGPLLSQRIEASPWVEKVVEVRRVFPGGLELDLKWRDPYAGVRVPGGYLLVDERGEILPCETAEPPVLSPWIVLDRLGTDDPRSGVPASWFADAVREGVFVLKDLVTIGSATIFDEFIVQEIDVSNFEGRLDPNASEVCLRGHPTSGAQPAAGEAMPIVIRWGRSTRHRRGAVEITLEQKLKNLEIASRTPGGLRGHRTIDARYDDALLIEPPDNTPR